MTRADRALSVNLEGVDASEQELRLLADWLQRERLSGVRLDFAAKAITKGQMGTVTDLIEVIAPGGAAGAVVASVQAWLQTRRGDFKIRLKRPDGAELEVERTNAKHSDEQLREFLRVFQDEQS